MSKVYFVTIKDASYPFGPYESIEEAQEEIRNDDKGVNVYEAVLLGKVVFKAEFVKSD